MVIFAILLGVLPSLIWLIFFLKEDLHPEPKGILARIFIYGSFTALMAVVFQYFFQDILNFFKIGEYAFISFFIFAAVEEILKLYKVPLKFKGSLFKSLHLYRLIRFIKIVIVIKNKAISFA